jgi:hypothetical protein
MINARVVVIQNEDLIDIIVSSPQSISAFKELIQRGANLWPDAPAEIKEFADLITSGQILQDYRSQK